MINPKPDTYHFPPNSSNVPNVPDSDISQVVNAKGNGIGFGGSVNQDYYSFLWKNLAVIVLNVKGYELSLSLP